MNVIDVGMFGYQVRKLLRFEFVLVATQHTGIHRKELRRMNNRKDKYRLKSIWNSMKQRCDNVNCKPYKYYGAKGIKICNQWRNFKTFSKWALKSGYTYKLTIDRINPGRGYSPDNCQWLTKRDNIIKSNYIVDSQGLEILRQKYEANKLKREMRKRKNISSLKLKTKKIYASMMVSNLNYNKKLRFVNKLGLEVYKDLSLIK